MLSRCSVHIHQYMPSISIASPIGENVETFDFTNQIEQTIHKKHHKIDFLRTVLQNCYLPSSNTSTAPSITQLVLPVAARSNCPTAPPTTRSRTDQEVAPLPMTANIPVVLPQDFSDSAAPPADHIACPDMPAAPPLKTWATVSESPGQDCTQNPWPSFESPVPSFEYFCRRLLE